jgi:hypothetical protein
MNLGRLLALPFRYQPWRPRHLRLIVKDLIAAPREPVLDHKTHLNAAINWLCRAQDVRNEQMDAGGVSAGWDFEGGWLPSYPETTGYIIETFVPAAKILERPNLCVRANRMLDWELSIQLSDGAFPGHYGEPGSQPVVFNTGQIMHGMLCGYLELRREECLAAAVRAGFWMAAQQDDDGCFRRYEHYGVPHVYNTRAIWALLRTALASGESALKRAVVKNLEWALAQQRASGWFSANAFKLGEHPFTHTIAYAIRGFLECGILLSDERLVNAAAKAARALAFVQRADGGLMGAYADDWIPKASYLCLTGIAQMGVNWIRLGQEGIAPELVEPARRAIEFLKTVHRLSDRDDAVRGGIAGSMPIWGAYARFEFPNWAAKFFADALMMDSSGEPIPPRACSAAAPSRLSIDV